MVAHKDLGKDLVKDENSDEDSDEFDLLVTSGECNFSGVRSDLNATSGFLYKHNDKDKCIEENKKIEYRWLWFYKRKIPSYFYRW